MTAIADTTPISRRPNHRRRGLRGASPAHAPAPTPRRNAGLRVGASVEVRIFDHVFDYFGDTYFEPISSMLDWHGTPFEARGV
jgi:hypothetical protein